MQIGKDGGKSFVFTAKWNRGLSIFIPATRNTWAVSFGLGWVVNSRPGKLSPHAAFFVLRNPFPFYRMWGARQPFTVLRVGTWRAPA